jgi:hypothetical protein
LSFSALGGTLVELLVIYLKRRSGKCLYYTLIPMSSLLLVSSLYLKKNLPLNNEIYTNIDKYSRNYCFKRTIDKKIMKDDNGPKKFVLVDEVNKKTIVGTYHLSNLLQELAQLKGSKNHIEVGLSRIHKRILYTEFQEKSRMIGRNLHVH